MEHGPLDFLPLWALFLATCGIVLISIDAGFRIARYRAASGRHEVESSVGAMTAASLALLAFLLAFTFGFAASRLETRRKVLVEEANAIGTTYLRTLTLPEAERGPSRALLREYVDVRLAAVETKDLDAAITRSLAIQNELWEHAAALARAHPESIVIGLYLQALNAMIDVHTTRLTESVSVRVPRIFWLALYGITVLAMAEMGYQMGLAGNRRALSTPAFAVAYALVMLLIADLDRPLSGWVRSSQQPIIELRRSMTE